MSTSLPATAQDAAAALALVRQAEAYQDEVDPTVRTGWQIQNLPSFEWALERMAQLETEKVEIEASLEEAHRALDERAAKLLARCGSGIAFFEQAGLRFMEQNRAALLRGKAKSRTFLHGKAGWRGRAARLVVKDEDAALAWALALPEAEQAALVRAKREVSKSGLQELFKTTGEIPPGCEVEPERDEPFVKAEALPTTLVNVK